MTWTVTPISDGTGELLLREQEDAVIGLSFEGVGRCFDDRDAERGSLPCAWRLRVWRTNPGSCFNDLCLEHDRPSLVCFVSTRDVLDRAGEEHAYWVRSTVLSSLERLRRYQEGSAGHAPEETLARMAAGAEGRLRRDAGEVWSELLFAERRLPTVTRAPDDYAAFVCMVPSRPTNLRVRPRDTPTTHVRYQVRPPSVLFQMFARSLCDSTSALSARALVVLVFFASSLTAVSWGAYSLGRQHAPGRLSNRQETALLHENGVPARLKRTGHRRHRVTPVSTLAASTGPPAATSTAPAPAAPQRTPITEQTSRRGADTEHASASEEATGEATATAQAITTGGSDATNDASGGTSSSSDSSNQVVIATGGAEAQAP